MPDTILPHAARSCDSRTASHSVRSVHSVILSVHFFRDIVACRRLIVESTGIHSYCNSKTDAAFFGRPCRPTMYFSSKTNKCFWQNSDTALVQYFHPKTRLQLQTITEWFNNLKRLGLGLMRHACQMIMHWETINTKFSFCYDTTCFPAKQLFLLTKPPLWHLIPPNLGHFTRFCIWL